MRQAERLTTVAGETIFVLTLWPKAQEQSPPPLYLRINRQQAEDLVASLQDWLRPRASQQAAARSV
jgi:hypothetical protein